MAIWEPLGGILGLKLAILEHLGAHLEALGGQGRHMVGIYEAYGRHMGGIWRQKGGKREPNKNSFWRIFWGPAECAGPGCLLSAYKQTYMPAYTAFLLPSAKGPTRPASLHAGGAPNLIAPRIPPGQKTSLVEGLCSLILYDVYFLLKVKKTLGRFGGL